MRELAKKSILGLWLLGAIIVGTIFRQNIEEAASERGYDKIIDSGWRGVTGGGYEVAALFGFAVLTGMLLAVHGEWLLRKWERRKRLSHKTHISFGFENAWLWKQEASGIAGEHWSKGSTIYSGRPSDPAVSDNIYTLVLVFDQDIEAPYVSIFSESKLIWRIVDLHPRFISLAVDFREDHKSAIEIVVRPSAWPKLGGASQDTMKWYDAW